MSLPVTLPEKARPKSAKASTQRHLKVLLALVVAFLAFVPLPFGSNRSILWAVNAAILSLVAIGWGAALIWARQSFTLGFGARSVLGVLFGAYCLFLLFQILPFYTARDLVPSTISIAPGETYLMLIRAASYALLFVLVCVLARDRSNARKLLDALFAINGLYALIGLLSLRMGDTILGMAKWSYFGSATGSFVNRNSFATFLAFGLVLGLSILLHTVVRSSSEPGRHDGLPWPRIGWLLIALVTVLAALIATESRMGLLSAFAGLLVVVCIAFSMGRITRRSILIAGVVLALGIAIALLNLQGVLNRFLSADASLEVRMALYQQTIDLIGLRPFLGLGGGSFEIAFPLVHQPPVDTDLIWDKAHNTYLSLWSGLGLIAGSIPILIVALIAVAILRNIDRQRWSASSTALGVIVVAAVHSFFDFSLEIQAVTFWFVALMAVGYARSLAIKSLASRSDRPSTKDQVGSVSPASGRVA